MESAATLLARRLPTLPRLPELARQGVVSEGAAEADQGDGQAGDVAGAQTLLLDILSERPREPPRRALVHTGTH